MRRYLSVAIAAVCLCVGAAAQQGVAHDKGDPRTMSPTPNCAGSRFYVDDSTGKMYQANTGSPCVWTDPTSFSGTVPFANTGVMPAPVVTNASNHFTSQTQGIALDPSSNAYYFSTATIAAYNSSDSLQWTNSTPFAGLPGSPDHLGDGEYSNGVLYAAVMHYGGCPGTSSGQLIARYSAATGALSGYFDVSAAMGGADISGVAVVPATNTLVASTFCGGAQIYLFDLTTGASKGTVTLSTALPFTQGVSYNPTSGQLALSVDSSVAETDGYVYFASLGGAVTGPVYSTTGGTSDVEGLDYTQSSSVVALDIGISVSTIRFANAGAIGVDVDGLGTSVNLVAVTGGYNYAISSALPATKTWVNASGAYSMVCPSGLSQPFTSASCHVSPAGLGGTFSVGGDLVCAQAADSTVGALSVTAVSSTASTMTYTVAATPNYIYAGQIVQAQGNTTTGYNGGPFMVASTTSTTITVTSAANPGAGTAGGTLSLYCSNQVTDGSAGFTAFATTYTLPANTWGVSIPNLTITKQYAAYSAAAGTVPFTQFSDLMGSTNYFSSSQGLTGSANAKGAAGVHVEYLSAVSPTLIAVSTGFAQVGNTSTADGNGLTSPIPTTTNAARSFVWRLKYQPTGVVSGTYTSGITATGTVGQTCALTAFNNSSTATATVALTGTNTIAASTALVITARGTGNGTAPTSATAGNGTATCSGTATIATVLGGAPGYATQLLSVMVK